MENYLNKFDEVIESIKNSNDYKEYLELYQNMLNNTNANNLINEIKSLQKQLVIRQYNKECINDIDEIINGKINILKSIPLYEEYINKQAIINEELLLIKGRIEDYIEDVIN